MPRAKKITPDYYAELTATSDLEQAFLSYLRIFGSDLPDPVSQFRFDPSRKWRSDYAWIDSRLIVELEGGVWQGGRHTSGAGFTKDCEKYNRAAELGYQVLRFTSGMLESDPDRCIEQIRNMLKKSQAKEVTR